MAEGTEIAKGLVTIQPNSLTSEWLTQGERAGASFSKGFEAKLQASMSGVGASLGKSIEPQITAANQKAASSFSMISGAANDAAKQVANAMTAASRGISTLSRQVGITGFELQQVGQTLTMAVTAPVTALLAGTAAVGLKMATTIENAEVSLKAFLGPGYDVMALINRLKAESIASPVFDLGQILNFTKGLVGAGMQINSAEAEVKALDKIFTTYGVTGAAVNDMLLGFSQVQSKGVAQSEELTKQIGQQIPIWSLLSQVTGKTQAELRNMVKAKDISGQAFADLVVKMGDLPAIMEGSANGIHTLSAQWSMLKENFQTNVGTAMLANFDQIKASLALLSPDLDKFAKWFGEHLPAAIEHLHNFAVEFNKLMDAWDRLTPEKRADIEKILTALVVAGPAFLIISKSFSGIAAGLQIVSLLMNPVAVGLLGIGLVLAGAVLGFIELYKRSEEFRNGVKIFVSEFKDGWNKYIVPGFKDLLKTVKEDLVPAFEHLINALGFNDWKSFGKWLADELVGNIQVVIKELKGVVQVFSDIIIKIGDAVQAFRDFKAQMLGADITRANGSGAGQIPSTFHQQGELEPLIKSFGNLKDAVDNLYGSFSKLFGQKSDGESWSKSLSYGSVAIQVQFSLLNAATSAMGSAFQFTANAMSFKMNELAGTIRFFTGAGALAFQVLSQIMTATMDYAFSKIHALVANLRAAWDQFWRWMSQTVQGSIGTITNVVEGLKNNLFLAFNSMAAGIRNIWSQIQGIVQEPVQFIINTVYGQHLKPFIDQVASALGVSVTMPDQHFASGGQVQGDPSRGDWIPVWATAGERILSLGQVAQLGGHGAIDRLLSAGHYASGGVIGALSPGNVFSSLSGDLSAIKTMTGGLAGGDFGKIAGGAMMKLIDGMVSKFSPLDIVKSFVSAATGQGGSGLGGPVSGSLAEWITAASKYVNIENPSALVTLIMRESAGDPHSYNGWDINAINGDPSRGLMQTIGATFARYRDPRLPDDIYDPVANIVAGMNYIHAQYGSLNNVQQAVGATPMGYANGVQNAPRGLAWVGERGPELMNFRGGESVTPLGGATTIHLDLDLGEGIHQAVEVKIDRHNRAIARVLRDGGGRR